MPAAPNTLPQKDKNHVAHQEPNSAGFPDSTPWTYKNTARLHDLSALLIVGVQLESGASISGCWSLFTEHAAASLDVPCLHLALPFVLHSHDHSDSVLP